MKAGKLFVNSGRILILIIILIFSFLFSCELYEEKIKKIRNCGRSTIINGPTVTQQDRVTMSSDSLYSFQCNENDMQLKKYKSKLNVIFLT